MFPPWGRSALLLLLSLAPCWGLAAIHKQGCETGYHRRCPDGTSSRRKWKLYRGPSLLKRALGQISDKDVKRKSGLDGVHCAMTLNEPNAAVDFLQMLTHEFPHDPEVLYETVHAYSDLSTMASQELGRTAPSSPQAHELLAESYEMQAKWNDAEKEYQTILKQDPTFPAFIFGSAAYCCPNRIRTRQLLRKPRRSSSKNCRLILPMPVRNMC
jgi:tetratricopeptide (TPR) repeat protein